jgi:hypothetical protein
MKQLLLFSLLLLCGCKEQAKAPTFMGGSYSYNIPNISPVEGNMATMDFTFSLTGTYSGKLNIHVECLEMVSTFSGTYIVQDSLLLLRQVQGVSDVFIGGKSAKKEHAEGVPEKDIAENLTFSWNAYHIYNPRDTTGMPTEELINLLTEQLTDLAPLVCLGNKIGDFFDRMTKKVNRFKEKFNIK